MAKVKITRNFQVTIPSTVRNKLDLKEGEEVDIHLNGEGRIVIERLPKERRVLKSGKRLLPDEIEEIIEKGLAESFR